MGVVLCKPVKMLARNYEFLYFLASNFRGEKQPKHIKAGAPEPCQITLKLLLCNLYLPYAGFNNERVHLTSTSLCLLYLVWTSTPLSTFISGLCNRYNLLPWRRILGIFSDIFVSYFHWSYWSSPFMDLDKYRRSASQKLRKFRKKDRLREFVILKNFSRDLQWREIERILEELCTPQQQLEPLPTPTNTKREG